MFKINIFVTLPLWCLVALSLNASEVVRTPIWGLSERQGRRPEMEDDAFQSTLQLGQVVPQAQLFGIFDGHCGPHAAQLAARQMGGAFKTCFERLSSTITVLDKLIEQAFFVSFDALDKVIRTKYKADGATALSALVTNDEVYLSWIGDSRGLVVDSNGKIKCSTTDHKPDSPRELKRYSSTSVLSKQYRIRHKKGNEYYRWEIYGQDFRLGEDEKVLYCGPWRLGPLSISRALGDREVKRGQPLIISEPETIKTAIEVNDIIVLACDGVWDVLTNYEVASFVTKLDSLDLATLEKEYPVFTEFTADDFSFENGSDLKMQIIARALRDKAYEYQSSDNLSVMVIKIT